MLRSPQNSANVPRPLTLLLMLSARANGQTTSVVYSISRVEPEVQACAGVPVALRISANVSGHRTDG
jgi:hypothetical protein